MKRTNIILSTIAIIILIVIFGVASYAFIHIGNLNVTNVSNFTATSETNNMVFDALGGVMELNVTAVSMSDSLSGNVAAENTAILTVNFQANTIESMVCNYDIIYEWTSTDKYQAHTSGVTENEYTIQASLAANEHVNEGNNLISSDTDLADIVGNQNSATVVQRAKIDSTGTSTSTATWTMTSKFFNVDADQDALSGKNYTGRFKVANVSCVAGTAAVSLVEFLTNNAPRSGTDAVSSSPWILTSDHTGEWRYAGKNPDNYIEFNGELWRIIGVMPNMTYCTGTYGNADECNTTATGNLVKIIRNQTISSSTLSWDYKQSGVGSSASSYGSNDWSDSQLMLMLNGTNYLKTGYDVNNNKLHNSYTITSNVVAGNGYNYYNATYSYLDGNGTTVNIPSSATTSAYTATSGTLYKKIESGALSQIATVKWDLYGTSSYSTAATGSPEAFYNKERNINDTGTVYTGTTPENRPVYWYGKIGLMYPSDYGYATNGGTTYNRDTCLGYQMSGWNSGDYKTDCAGNSYLWYNNITSTAPGTSGTVQWTMSPIPSAYRVFNVDEAGYVYNGYAYIARGVRPVLYLKADTFFSGGNGTYDSPYLLS